MYRNNLRSMLPWMISVLVISACDKCCKKIKFQSSLDEVQGIVSLSESSGG
jgi:hypothetical protein